MLVFIRFTLFFVMIILLLMYLFTNIKFIGEGSIALHLLVFYVLLGGFLIILEIILKQNVYIKKSFLFLMLFFTYFINNITLNRPNDLKALTLATTGGTILFYILGSLISINLLYIKEKILTSNKMLNIFNFFYIAFSFIFFILFLNVFSVLMENVRKDVFLLNLDGMYQRPGNFLIISFLIYSFITALFLFVNKYIKKSKFVSLISFVLFCFYCLFIIGGMLLSQLIGSNNALINLVGLMFATLVFYILINFTNSKNLLSQIKLNIKEIFLTKLSPKLFSSMAISLFILLFSFIGLTNFFNLDLSKFRIFGFGSGEISSISTRLSLWKNFIIHFEYNPIFGNMAVEYLTTGEGTYVHSFLASLLTHLGIIGFMIFFVYLFKAIKEKLKDINNLYVDNLFTLYSLIVFVGIFIVASFGTFVTWAPIWFLLGLVFPPIVLK